MEDERCKLLTEADALKRREAELALQRRGLEMEQAALESEARRLGDAARETASQSDQLAERELELQVSV